MRGKMCREYYTYCNPEQILLAEQGDIVNFLENNAELSKKLKQATIGMHLIFVELYRGDLNYYSMNRLSKIMSINFSNFPNEDLTYKFTKHIINQRVINKSIDGFLGALGPIIVCMALKENLIKKS